MHTAPQTLAETLAPASADEFLQDTLGKTYKYVPGKPGKFCDLLTWPDLNRILALQQLDAPRLRLARDGKTLPPATRRAGEVQFR